MKGMRMYLASKWDWTEVNRLHACWFRPEAGWDPVPSEHAIRYADNEWNSINTSLLDELAVRIGGFSGKRVLDLGGGPGQYTVAFAQRGADVTWHDISRTYRDIAQRKASEHGVSNRVRFSLGYLDSAPDLLGQQFDLVFNRICWYYGFSDRGFAKVIYRLVAPGGYAYVDTNHSGFRRNELSRNARFRTWLNEHLAIKIGHPFPPHGRAAKMLLRYPMGLVIIDYRSPLNDRIFFQKG
jgi:SAM-dependent methyltransferase